MTLIYHDSKLALRNLYTLANTQGGYFTAKQALGVGYRHQHLDYHTKAANFERVAQGLYRLPTVVASEHDDLLRCWLWSRDRTDTPQAVASHETALQLYGLGEMLPDKMHFTVPPSFRKKVPFGCIMHRAQLSDSETREYESFRVTSPLRTLIDIAADSTVPTEQLQIAVRDALDRGLVRRVDLVAAVESNPSCGRLGVALESSSHDEEIRKRAGIQDLSGITPQTGS